jgi:tetratricopeptide (TPR) repeat protein
LIQAATDTHLWADSFDRQAEDAYALSSTVAETVARITGATTTRAAERQVSAEAHDAYLRGRYFWFANDSDRSQQYLEKAIQAQPDYALAWSGLADMYIVRAVAGTSPPDEVMARARPAIATALALDDSLAEAHDALGALHLFSDWDFRLADKETHRAIELNPTYAEAHHLRAYVMLAMNRGAEALQEQSRSTELDPFARPWALGMVLMHLRQFDAAMAELRLRKAALPQDRSIVGQLATCYAYKHMDAEAAQELAAVSRLFKDEQNAAGILQAFASGGMRSVNELRLQNAVTRSRSTYVSPLVLAAAHARLEHREETIAMLQAAVRERSPFLVLLQTDPEFDFLHGDDRYEAIVRRIGLAASPAASPR